MKKFLTIICILCIGAGSLFAQNVQVSGTVTNAEDGHTLPGVSVVVKGSTLGTTTDINGKYSFSVPAGSTLVFTFVGMATQEIAIGDRRVIDVVMEAGTQEIDEIVVVAYGTRKKGAITGSIATVSAKEAAKLPVGSFDQALQGKASGVQVTTNSGRPGAVAKIRIRGHSSINAGTDPLYVIDGVVASSTDFASFSSMDIESVSILKDASATALYGSRGANGVILVTTKRGVSGERAFITYKGSMIFSKKTKENFELMNTQQKLDYEIFNGLKQANDPQIPDLLRVETDWVDELMGETALGQTHEVSVRGGTQKIRYYTSLNYMDLDGILINSDMRRYGFMTNLDADATQNLKIGASINAAQMNTKNTVTMDLDDYYMNSIYNPAFRALLENPYMKVRRDDGSYTTTEDGLFWGNPIEHLELNPNDYSDLRLFGNVWAELSFLKKFKARTLLGIEYVDNTVDNYISPNSAWGLSTGGSVTRGLGRTTRVTNTNTITYEDSFLGVHNLTALVGQETYQYRSDAFTVRGAGLANEKVKVLAAASTWDGSPGTGSTKLEYTVASFFASVNYDYDKKYFADLSFRYDGCSRFGTGNRWGTFGSIGLMWDVLKENFMPYTDFLSTLKLKTSFGITGNNSIPNYAALALYGVSGTYNNQPAGLLSVPGNSDLSWEKVNLFDIGLNLGFFDERIKLEVGYYNKTTTDMLFSVPYSYTTGFASGYKNIGKMVNQGIEAQLSVDIIDTNDLLWNAGGTFSYNKNEVTELYGEERFPNTDNATILEVGAPKGARYINRFAGVNPANGKTLWLDKEGNVTETFRPDDAVTLNKSWIPTMIGGVQTAISYKGIELQADFTYMLDFWIINNARYFTESNGAFAQYSQSTKMLDHWKQPGDITSIPDPRYKIQEFDDRILENASFFRFRSLMLSYAFPSKWLEKTRIFERARIYAQGYNLYTWTNYTGYDPEQYGEVDLGSYPQIRSFVLGIELGF